MINVDYLYNPDAKKSLLDKDYSSDKKLGFQVIEHGNIFPHKMFPCEGWKYGGGGVFDDQGNFVKDSYENYKAGESYPRPTKEEIYHSNETVIYLDVFGSCWGNILAEHLSRVWFLKTDVFQKEFKNCRLAYTPRQAFNLNDIENTNFRRLLEILEINAEDLQVITKPTQFDKVIVPDLSLFLDGYKKFTNEYCETLERVRIFALKNRTPVSTKKVYYFHGRRAFGEELIAKYFKLKGYEIIQPEKLTLDEQLNWLINCESFASTIGSSSHNSIFLNEHTEVILIPRSNNLFPGYQELMDQVRSLNVSYIDSTLSILHNDNGFFLYIVSPQLKHFFGDNFDGYQEDDFKIFLQYVKEGLNRGFSVNPSAKKYYDPILSEFLTQLKQHKDLIVAHNMPPSFETFLSPLDHQSDIDKEGWLLSKFMTGVKQRNDLASTPNTSPHFEKSLPPLSYQTHVNREGWSSWIEDNQISNDISQNLNLQAIKIDYSDHKIYYSVYHNEEEGWSEEVTAGQMAGTTGKSKPIYGMKVRLDEAGSKEFDIFYSMHKFDGTWTPWAKNGENLYSYGQKLNAIQIKLESKKDMI